ncbi:MAG: hypothetical protein QOJ39_826 [Candidatus Eremiobacteraeota bacterium]|jgi:polysaccharide pyruvyl transferase WcaK-like protein|nr:hypothetical protein [Candidatus Eremiobacteraeota bacterium]
MAPSSAASVVFIADVGPDPFHVGDEAMLEANVETLRQYVPSARVTVLGRDEATDDELSEALRTAAGLFVSGGGNLRSPFPGLLRHRVHAMREARRLGIPVVTGGQTIGPDLSAVDRAALIEGLAGVAHVGVRETASLAFALQMGIPPERISYQADDAFLLARRRPADINNARAAAEPFVAVTFDPSFLTPEAGRELEQLAAQLASITFETGLRIVFVPHVGPRGEIGSEDGRVGRALQEHLRGAGVPCTVLPVLRAAETVWITQRAAAVVSSRYHPLVFATAAAVPSLGIHRDPYTRVKLEGALAHAGMTAWSQSASTAAGGGLIVAFRRLWGDREAVRNSIARACAPILAREAGRWQVLLSALRLPQPYAEKAQPRIFPSLIGWRGNGAATVKRTTVLSEQQWSDYARDGFLELGEVVDAPALAGLRQRADDLATGRVQNADVRMELDSGSTYDDLPGLVSSALGTLRYRKIAGLENDDRFAPLVRHPLFLEIAAHQYGPHVPISVFRAIVFNKPAEYGSVLPWHQDGGDVWALDRDPLLTIWIALDSATTANGCMEVIPGSHRFGLLGRRGTALSDENVARYCAPERVVPLEVKAGHGVMLHNWLLHRSGVNGMQLPRRAFSICYMDGRTLSTLTGARFPVVAGSLPPEPHPYVRELQDAATDLRAQSVAAVEYATSLREANTALEQSMHDATRYAADLKEQLTQATTMRKEAERYASDLKKHLEAARAPAASAAPIRSVG